MKSVQLWKKVQHLGWICLRTWSIHKLHLFWLKHIIGVNPSLGLHSQLVLKLKQSGKTSNVDLILLNIFHPHKLLCLSIKVESGIKLTNDFLVPIILEAQHLGHLQFITCGLDLIEHCMPPCCHPVPIYPLSLHHGRVNVATLLC
jgi:hypothetical protein